VENFAEFIFADHQFLFIFADLRKSAKKVLHKFLLQTISSLKVYGWKKYSEANLTNSVN